MRFWSRLIFSSSFRYSPSCAKLRFALYMIWVLSAPVLEISTTSAIMLSLSRRLDVESIRMEFTLVAFSCIVFGVFMF